jgi:hypothetical protein
MLYGANFDTADLHFNKLRLFGDANAERLGIRSIVSQCQ